MIASEMGLEISDLPPPETVHGLWQNAPSGNVPMSRQLGAAWCFAIRTRYPLGWI
jgi:hypothetical protein